MISLIVSAVDEERWSVLRRLLAVVGWGVLLLTSLVAWGSEGTVPEVVGPDDVGSPLFAVVLFLFCVALVCVGVWLALVAVALAVGLVLVATGVVSGAAVWAAWRGRNWSERGSLFVRTASGAGGLLSGVALGGLVHLVWPKQVSYGLGLAGGAAAGLGAGLLLFWLLRRLAQAVGRWLEARVR